MHRLLNDVVRTLVPLRQDRHGPLPPLMLMLTVITGLVDAVSYLGLGHVFVANMTGNVVFLGFALVGAVNLSVLASAVALAAFLVGALAGGRLGTWFAAHRGKQLKTASAVQTFLVAVTVAAAAVTDGRVTTGVQYTLIVFLGLGMGLQNAVARRLGVPDLTTTVLTLTLTGLAADSTPAGGEAPRPGRRILSVLAMFLGAFVGAQLVLHGHLVLTLSLALILLAVISVATHRLSAADPAWTRSAS
ncbi:YoaK family protein [Streptomyces sasae]|uniref:YoaK family protein n=1 Tax=Streptomyces sasae TaxID=1266772 RepID=UPI00292EE19E|nr:YoaK family protein [Streptomyces sasae]